MYAHLSYLKRQKQMSDLKIQSALIFWHMNCYMIFTVPPWRPCKHYIVSCKTNTEQHFCFSTHSASKLLGILQCKERSLLSQLLFFFTNSLCQYLWQHRKLFPKELRPAHSTVQVGATLMLKLSWFNFKAAPPWGPLNSGTSDTFLCSVRAWIIFNLLDMLQRSIYSLTETENTRVWGKAKGGIGCCWLLNIVSAEKKKLFRATSTFLHCLQGKVVWTGTDAWTAAHPCSCRPAEIFDPYITSSVQVLCRIIE